MMLFLQQTPTLDTPAKSWAHELLRDRRSLRSPLGLAAWGGFGDLRKHLLPPGDEEVRVWGGFGMTNLQGVILRKRSDNWTAVRLIGGISGTKFPSRKQAYWAPKTGWPAFWLKAERLGIWTLPDESMLPQKGRRAILDGFSYLVELQRDRIYKAYAYDNPAYQAQWPEAKRMIKIWELLNREFPLERR